MFPPLDWPYCCRGCPTEAFPTYQSFIFDQLPAGSHLYIGRGALLRDKSRVVAHRGCSSLK